MLAIATASGATFAPINFAAAIAYGRACPHLHHLACAGALNLMEIFHA